MATRLYMLFHTVKQSSLRISTGTTRFYAKNPLESRSKDALLGSVGGGRGGRGGRGRKKGGKKGMKFDQQVLLGKGKKDVHWGGLSHSLSAGRLRYGATWMPTDKFGMTKISDAEGEESHEFDSADNVLIVRQLEGSTFVEKSLSKQNWSKKGWSGRTWGGKHVGCPELPDGTPVTDFSSTVIELKRVSNQTKAGKKRTVSCLIVVGNGNGVAGYAVGRGEEVLAAVRKAKNKAINSLQFVPRYGDRTVYHNTKVKYCRTTISFERRVSGSGLKCQRAIRAICELVGIRDMRAKITGSTNPLNVVHATLKGLTRQETHQSLADETDKFLVEYHDECSKRPLVSSMPKSQQSTPTTNILRDMKMLQR